MKSHLWKFSFIALALSGCQTVYQKPGATPQDWSHDYNDCLVKAHQAGYYESDLGAALDRKRFLQMCVEGQGWTQQTEATKSADAAKASEIETKRSSFKAKNEEFGQRSKDICAKKEYALIIVKTECLARDISFEKMADGSKITNQQKKVLLKFRTESGAVSKESIEYLRTNAVAETDTRFADYLTSTQLTADGYYLDLYAGRTTWGDFNKSRKDMAAAIEAKQHEIYQQKR